MHVVKMQVNFHFLYKLILFNFTQLVASKCFWFWWASCWKATALSSALGVYFFCSFNSNWCRLPWFCIEYKFVVQCPSSKSFSNGKTFNILHILLMITWWSNYQLKKCLKIFIPKKPPKKPTYLITCTGILAVLTCVPLLNLISATVLSL